MNQSSQAIEIDLSIYQGVSARAAHHSLQRNLRDIQTVLATKPGLTALDVMDLRDQRDETKAIIRGLESHERFGDDFSYTPVSEITKTIPFAHGLSCYCVDCLG